MDEGGFETYSCQGHYIECSSTREYKHTLEETNIHQQTNTEHENNKHPNQGTSTTKKTKTRHAEKAKHENKATLTIITTISTCRENTLQQNQHQRFT